jgi:hypothetical protein
MQRVEVSFLRDCDKQRSWLTRTGVEWISSVVQMSRAAHKDSNLGEDALLFDSRWHSFFFFLSNSLLSDISV